MLPPPRSTAPFPEADPLVIGDLAGFCIPLCKVVQFRDPCKLCLVMYISPFIIPMVFGRTQVSWDRAYERFHESAIALLAKLDN